jgi:hypothetical protein
MLLRESGKAVGDPVVLDAAVGRGGSGGVEHGEALVRFGEAVTKDTEDAPHARLALVEAIGPEGFVEACAIVGIFNGLVRTADASGIPLDDGTLAGSREFRGELGLESFPSAVNSPLGQAGSADGSESVAKLFE